MPRQRERWKLTVQSRRLILASIRAGAFEGVAAEAAGIPAQVFQRWLEWGNPVDRPKGWRPHRTWTALWQEVMEAKAQARLACEMKAMQDDPVAWLRSGPGKERPNEPGWSMPVRPSVQKTTNNTNIFRSPEMTGIM